MAHPIRASERGIGLHHDVVLLAEGGDLRSRVERMHFDLIDRRMDPWVRGEQLLQMFDAVVADTGRADLPVRQGIFDRTPTFESLRLPAVRSVDEIEINIAQSGQSERLFDGTPGGVVTDIRGQFGGEMDVFSFQPIGFVFLRLEIPPNRVTDFFLIVVHLRTVDSNRADSRPSSSAC